MNRKKLAAIAVAAAVVVATLFILRRDGEDPRFMTGSGTVEVTEVDLAFKIPGRVVDVLTDEGKQVRTGQVVAILDREELSEQLAAQEAALAAMRERHRELARGARGQEVAAAQAATAAAQAELERAQREWERSRTLFEREVISGQARDAARQLYETAQARYEQARQQESLVREGPRKEAVASAGALARQAEAQLEGARSRLADSELRASLPGVVLRRNVEPGETVAAGVPVLTVGDLQRPWVRVYVPEAKLGLLKIGQPAEVFVDSYPGRPFPGTVTYIASEAEFTPKNVQTKEERVKLVFAVKVAVDNPAGELKPGMPADVRILVQ